MLGAIPPHEHAPGALLITDVRRTCSVFAAAPGLAEEVARAIAREGSALGEVTADVAWAPRFDAAAEAAVPRVPTRAALQASALALEPGVFVPGVDVLLDVDAARQFALLLRGRTAHRRPFRLLAGATGAGLSVTFVTDECGDDMGPVVATHSAPWFLAAPGALQAWLSPAAAVALAATLERASVMADSAPLPRWLSWPGRAPGLHVVVVSSAPARTA